MFAGGRGSWSGPAILQARGRALQALLAIGLALGACRQVRERPAVPAGEDPLRWSADIAAFVDADRAAPFPAGGVVFVGSSSIRLWDTLARDMAPLQVLNRGFGGSRLFDSVYWAGELVDVHAPRAVVVFSGTNDLAGDDAKAPEAVRDLFRALVARLRERDADLAIAYVAITPTLARERHLEAVREANRLIRAECEADTRLEFVDPTPDLMDADGRPDARYFRDDRLHLNAAGYAVWTRHVRPVVERLLALSS